MKSNAIIMPKTICLYIGSREKIFNQTSMLVYNCKCLIALYLNAFSLIHFFPRNSNLNMRLYIFLCLYKDYISVHFSLVFE